MTIEDFGKKIGGAKKDLWKERGLSIPDILEMNEAEKQKFIKKDSVWEKPDYEALVKEGLSVRVVYFMKLVRDAIPVKPVLTLSDASKDRISEKQEGYIAFVGKLRDAVMQLKTENDVLGFYHAFVDPYLIRKPGTRYVDIAAEAFGCINNKLLKTAQVSDFRVLDRDIKKKQFCFSEDEKILAPYTFLFFNQQDVEFQKYKEQIQMIYHVPGGKHFFYPEGEFVDSESWKNQSVFIMQGSKFIARNFDTVQAAKDYILTKAKAKEKELSNEVLSSPTSKPRKKKFVPKQLAHIERDGEDYRKGKNIEGADYLETFCFRGGEFGNWLNEKDRQYSLNYGYDAFLDLAKALKVEPKDISLEGGLSIAFGARGSGSALAHYESMREVINLTKLKGAGSLAHEWGHALDDFVGKKLGFSGFLSANRRSKNVPESFKKLIDCMLYKTVYNEDIRNTQITKAEKYKTRINQSFYSLFDLNSLASEQQANVKQLISACFTESNLTSEAFGSAILSGNGTLGINKLSAYKKELTGCGISKDDRVSYTRCLYQFSRNQESIGMPQKVKTDFYQNSIQFDQGFSKTSHGYWQSTEEMFARAFACYIADKVEGKSDYLCGHADLACGPIMDRSGKIEFLKAFPEGEERRTINQCFDDFFVELKEREFLHDKEWTPILEKEIVKTVPSIEQKPSLDSLISKGKKTVSQGMDTSCHVGKNGQLEFTL